MRILIETKVEITEEQIADLFCTAFYGGIDYWAELKCDLPKDIDELDLSYEEKLAKAIFSDREYHFCVIDIDADEKYIVTIDSIQRGIQMVAEIKSDLFQEFLEEGYDCIVADRMMQNICFGEELYG